MSVLTLVNGNLRTNNNALVLSTENQSPCCCGTCADNCVGVVNYSITVYLLGYGDFTTTGYFNLSAGTHYFNYSLIDVGYISGSIAVECSDGKWTVEVYFCYGTNYSLGGIETWRAVVNAESSGCPPNGTIQVADIDPPSTSTVTVNIT